MWVTYLLIVLIMFIASRSTSAEEVPPSSGRGELITEVTVDGSVTEVDSSLPINRARVELIQSGSRAKFVCETDSSGHCTIILKTPGSYFAHVEADGYIGKVVPLTIRAGTSRTIVDLTVRKTGAISGQLIDDGSHAPIGGATVGALIPRYIKGYRLYFPVGSTATTDSKGHFRITDVSPGEVLLEIVSSEKEAVIAGRLPDYTDKKPRPKGYPRTRWPDNRADGNGISGVRLQPGSELDLRRVNIHQNPLLRIRAAVRGSACQPEQMVNVSLLQRYGGMVIARAFTTARCRSDISLVNLAAGEYLLIASQSGTSADQPHSSLVHVQLSTQDADVDLELQAPQRVSGRITLENTDTSALRNMIIRLAPIVGITSGERHTSPDSEGRFYLNMYPGRQYEVVIAGLEAPNYVRELQYNGVTLSGFTLQPDWSAMAHSLTIAVSGRGATVEGVVSPEGKAISGLSVMIVPWPLSLSDRYPIYDTAMTDDKGRFSKQGLKPGRYRIIAASESAVRRLQDPHDFTDAVEATSAVEVRLAEGDVKAVTVDTLLWN